MIQATDGKSIIRTVRLLFAFLSLRILYSGLSMVGVSGFDFAIEWRLRASFFCRIPTV